MLHIYDTENKLCQLDASEGAKNTLSLCFCNILSNGSIPPPQVIKFFLY